MPSINFKRSQDDSYAVLVRNLQQQFAEEKLKKEKKKEKPKEQDKKESTGEYFLLLLLVMITMTFLQLIILKTNIFLFFIF